MGKKVITSAANKLKNSIPKEEMAEISFTQDADSRNGQNRLLGNTDLLHFRSLRQTLFVLSMVSPKLGRHKKKRLATESLLVGATNNSGAPYFATKIISHGSSHPTSGHS